MEKKPVFRGHIVDLIGRRIFGGEIIVKDGRIDRGLFDSVQFRFAKA